MCHPAGVVDYNSIIHLSQRFYNTETAFTTYIQCTSTHSLQLEIAVSSVGIGDSLVRAGINTHCVAGEGIYKLFLEKVVTEVDAYHMTITTTRWSSA